MASEGAFVIAADSGGTHTRVACYGLDGALLGYAVGRGGSPYHNADAAADVSDATIRAVRGAGLDAANAVGLVAGLAMISRPGSNQGNGDNSWADDYFAIPGLCCDRALVNDAVVAHRGALLGEPGIIVIAGTGSMILAITAEGTEVESGQFEHYAGAARHLAFEAVQLALIGAAAPEDAEFVASVLAHWGVDDLAALRRALIANASADPIEVRRRYGLLAPSVSAAADESPLADRALRDLAAKTARGVELLVPLLGTARAAVATTGALAETAAFRSRLTDALRTGPAPHTCLVPPALDAVSGAALIAYERAGVTVTDALVARLRCAERSRVRATDARPTHQ